MDNDVVCHNYRPPELKLPNAVIDGLANPRESIPSKFLYNARSLELFDAASDQRSGNR